MSSGEKGECTKIVFRRACHAQCIILLAIADDDVGRSFDLAALLCAYLLHTPIYLSSSSVVDKYSNTPDLTFSP